MAALTKPRNTTAALGPDRKFPVEAATKILAGGYVQLNAAGNAVPGTANVANTGVGRAEETIDNTTGAAGDRTVKVRKGRFNWNNSTGADAIARTEIGKPVYLVDDNTVAKTNGGGTRPSAGTCHDVDANGVWVET